MELTIITFLLGNVTKASAVHTDESGSFKGGTSQTTIPRNIFTGTDSDFGLCILREMDSNAVRWGCTAWKGTPWAERLDDIGAKKVIDRVVPFKAFAEQVNDFLQQ